jgi:hypothetical protein
VNGCGRVVTGRPAPSVDELLLQGSDEALDDGVVQQLPRPLMSPPAFEGPTFTGITGTQGPTR